MIYIASPYSDPDPLVRDERYRLVCAFLAKHIEAGVLYSPIALWHPIAVAHELPSTAYFWDFHNRHMLAKADELWIYCLPGWEDSKGVDAERRTWLEDLQRLRISFHYPDNG